MKTLLIAIGIIISFGALFLLDRYNTGGNKEEPENEPVDQDSIDLKKD
jgi:hypothetical protein